MILYFLLILIVLILLGLIVALVYFSPLMNKLPKSTGPYSVGSVTYDWVDSSRREKLSKNSKDKRELVVQVWYPSKKNKKSKRLSYLPGRMRHIRRSFSKFSHLPKFICKNLFDIKSQTISKADILQDESAFPVIIFSHGLEAYRDSYEIFINELVSYGYVVVGIDHTYGCGLTQFPDGRLANVHKRLENKNLLDNDWIVFAIGVVDTWVKDIKFVLDKLKTINSDSKSRFFKKLDLNGVGMLGHSFGGITAVEAARQDPRIKIGISMDGWNSDINSSRRIDKPFVFLLGDESLYSGLAKDLSPKFFSILKMSKEQYKNWSEKMVSVRESFCTESGENCYQIFIKDSGHGVFTDFIFLRKPLRKWLNLNMGDVDPYDSTKAIRTYLRSFFDKYLLGKDLSFEEIFELRSPEEK
jgi:dienelactone hydrolase